MAKLVTLEPSKTYATKGLAIKAVNKCEYPKDWDLRYFIMPHDDGRFFPVFVGESAINHQIYFKFNVIN